MVAENVTATLSRGSAPEWIGVIFAAAVIVWGASAFSSSIEQKVQRIEASQQAILEKLDSEQRIARLERDAIIINVENDINRLNERSVRNAENIARIWQEIGAKKETL